MSEFTHFSPREPQCITVKANEQTLVVRRTTDKIYTVLYLTNNGDTPVYLGFTGTREEDGNAKEFHGITIFPKSTFVFDDPVPTGCSIWATASSDVQLGVQQ